MSIHASGPLHNLIGTDLRHFPLFLHGSQVEWWDSNAVVMVDIYWPYICKFPSRTHHFTVTIARYNRKIYSNNVFYRTFHFRSSLPVSWFSIPYNLHKVKCSVNQSLSSVFLKSVFFLTFLLTKIISYSSPSLAYKSYFQLSSVEIINIFFHKKVRCLVSTI